MGSELKQIYITGPKVQFCFMAVLETSSKRMLLSQTLFNIFLERIMSNALEDHKGKVSFGDWIFINFRFADDIVFGLYKKQDKRLSLTRLIRGQTTPMAFKEISR